MNLLALIPARGGSKGIPRKNIKALGGKPLIAWSIEAAQQSSFVSRVVVSTDDEEIASVARQWGAEVPFLRPAELALDDTPGIDPVLHALSMLSEIDWVLLLQPTSPMRTADDINGIIELQQKHGGASLVSVSEAGKHPYWMYQLESDTNKLVPFIDAPSVTCRQDLPSAYALNGAMYLAQTDWLKINGTFVTPETMAYVMPLHRSADLDTPIDWEWAEFLMQRETS